MGGDSADCPGVQLRSTWKSHYISPPPAPMREDDRVLIIPVGDSQWDDTGFDSRGHHRQINAVLGNLCRLHNPRIVQDKSGMTIPCTSWKHFALAENARHGNAQGAVKFDFWVRFL